MYGTFALMFELNSRTITYLLEQVGCYAKPRDVQGRLDHPELRGRKQGFVQPPLAELHTLSGLRLRLGPVERVHLRDSAIAQEVLQHIASETSGCSCDQDDVLRVRARMKVRRA